MKKLLIAFCLCFAFALPVVSCHAAQEIRALVSDFRLDGTPQEWVSGIIDIRRFSEVACVVVYDETEDTGGVDALVNVTLNPTSTVGDNAASGYFWDFGAPPPAGTMVNSKTISADEEYIFWFPMDLSMPYLQITVTGGEGDLDSGDYIDLTVYLIGKI